MLYFVSLFYFRLINVFGFRVYVRGGAAGCTLSPMYSAICGDDLELTRIATDVRVKFVIPARRLSQPSCSYGRVYKRGHKNLAATVSHTGKFSFCCRPTDELVK